jgi:hypothetical protein
MAYKQSTFAPFGIPNNSPSNIFNPNGVRPFQPEPLSMPFSIPMWQHTQTDYAGSLAYHTHLCAITKEQLFPTPPMTRAAHQAIMAELAAEKANNEKLIAENKRLIEDLNNRIARNKELTEDLKGYIAEYGYAHMHEMARRNALTQTNANK